MRLTKIATACVFMALSLTATVFGIPAGAETPEGQASSPSSAPPASDVTTIIGITDSARVEAGDWNNGEPFDAAKFLAVRSAVRQGLVRGTNLARPAPASLEGELALARAHPSAQETAASSSAIPSSARQSAPKDYASASECRAKAPVDIAAGWYKSHWSWCQSFNVVVRTFGRSGVPLGRLDFRLTQVGRGYQGKRQVQVDEWASEVNYRGLWSSGLPIIVVKMKCTGRPRPQQCSVSGGGADVLIEGHVAKLASFALNSSTGGASGSAKLATAVFHPTFTVSSGLLGTESGFEQAFRCDSASYLPSTSACIFHRLRGTFYLSRRDSAVNEAAKHIWDAQRSGLPRVLSRLVSSNGKKRNAAVALAACKRKWPSKPKGKDCDEYPFKSARQGAASGRFSVRYITSGDNRAAGRRLGTWLGQDRILDGDVYNVTVL